VGKTALAVRWAHRVRERFPDGQLYVDLRGYGPDQPVAPEDALGGFLRALGQEGAAIPQNVAERAARFRTLLDGRRTLVVLDNARSVEQVRPLLPGSPSCFAVITSRDALAGLVAREGAHRVSLDRLSLAEAHRLLRELLGEARVAAEPGAAGALIERCARLPLALRITAELARSQPSRTLADLAAELADQQGALDLLDIDGDPYTAVRAVFSWSYRRLDEAVARVFRLLGLHPGHDTDAHAVAALAGSGLRETRRALMALLRAHLVDQTSGGRYQPHDLLRAYAAELAAATDGPGEREAAMSRLLDYYLSTASAAMDITTPYEAYRRPKVSAFGGEAPPLASPDHARRWLDAERVNLLEITRHGDPAFTCDLAETIWRYLDIGSYVDEAITLHTRQLQAARAVGDVLAEAHACNHLGVALNREGTNEDAAIDHLEAALVGYERAGAPQWESAVRNNLGIVYGRRGEMAEAVRHLERALELTGPTGPWPRRRAVMLNISKCLKVLGRYEESFAYVQGALELCERHGDVTNQSNALVGMAEVYELMGRDDEARELCRRGLALARETGFRAVEGDWLSLLGILTRKRGEYDEALRYHDEALAVARSVGVTEVLAERLRELAATRAAAGRPAESLPLYDEALAVATEGSHRKGQADAHAGIAAVHAGRGETDVARKHWRQALARYEALGLPQAAEVRARLDVATETTRRGK
jgi:tetratricopeptide (TPR) repeat protein